MLMPKQAPPVIRGRGPSGRPSSNGLRVSEEEVLDAEVRWLCKKFKVRALDAEGNVTVSDQSLFAVMIPGEGGGWERTDIPCK